jgi:hypothetical protein
MEINLDKTKVVRISRQPFPVKLTTKNNWRMWNFLNI